MKRALLALAVLASLAAQQPPADSAYDADGHLKTEHQIPAGHSCMQRQVYEENAKRLANRGAKQSERLHPCDCTYTCHVDANGTVMETGGEKSTGCLSYCSKDQRRCSCHPEPVCDLGAHVALKDMDGRVVAVARRHR